ncbi:MAG: DUF4317 domain-containing protein [Clostridia bacterium]
MNDKEIGEIRRRFKIDRTNINSIFGCYVNDRREIISQFEQSMFNIQENEREMYLNLLKKVLTGTLNKNLLDISFTTKQTMDSEEHSLLMRLKDSSLKEDEALTELYTKIIESVMIEGNYLILIASEKYDVGYKSKDGGSFSEASDTVFNYFICALCPVKESTASLEFEPTENIFQNSGTSYKVNSPSIGFMFPCFDDRGTNIHNALFYTKSSTDNHPELIDVLFKYEKEILSADGEKEIFQSILCETLDDECDLETLQAVQNKLEFAILEHKESKNPEPMTMGKNTVLGILEDSGVKDEKVENFSKLYDEQFGKTTAINPKNIINERQFEVNTPNVIIKVKPEFKELIETRIIDGKKYILIDAENAVEVNGIAIDIKD